MAIARTEWTKFYLHPGGRTAPESVEGSPEPDNFTQPAPYTYPKVYPLSYRSEPMQQGMEVTGRVACYLEASID